MAPPPDDPVPLDAIHPFDPAVLEEPWDYYRRLRAEAPVYRDPHTGIFHVSTYPLVLEVVKNHAVFSNRFAQAMGGPALADAARDTELAQLAERAYPGVDTMLTADPPEHKRFRGLVNKAFTPRRVDALEGGIEALAHQLIDAFASRYDMRPVMDEYPRTERCAWESPVFFELLRRGLRWAAGKD